MEILSNQDIWKAMTGGERYDASHPHLISKLQMTRELIWEYNSLRPSETVRMREILDKILGSHGDVFQFNPPFRCDYGENIHIGEKFFANFNLTILDEAEVQIGDNVFIGPNVSMYTACHPLDAPTRNNYIEWAEPIKIGNSVWIGGSVTILAGVTIGDNVVIGAGSVVTRDIPSDCVAVGNPAHVIKCLWK